MNKTELGYDIWPAKVVLPGLNVEAEVPRGTGYKYLGEVKSLKRAMAIERLRLVGVIQEHRSVLDKLLGPIFDNFLIGVGCEDTERQMPGIDQLDDGCFVELIVEETRRAHLLAIKNGLPTGKAVFAAGGASSRYLKKTGQISVLQTELERSGVVGIKAEDYHAEEYNDIGGLLALKKAMEQAKANGRQTDIVFPEFKTPRPWLGELRRSFNL